MSDKTSNPAGETFVPGGPMMVPAQLSTPHPVRVFSEAQRLGLADAPPYSSQAKREAWEAGYETAIRDLCHGRLGEFRVAS